VLLSRVNAPRLSTSTPAGAATCIGQRPPIENRCRTVAQHAKDLPRLAGSGIGAVRAVAILGHADAGKRGQRKRVADLLREHGKGNLSSPTVLYEFSICSAQFGICGVSIES
jgi:hypothetical protein